MLSTADLKKAFDEFDTNKNGTLDLSEIEKVCAAIGITTDPARAREFFDKIDTDHSGAITFQEFAAWYRSGQNDSNQAAFQAVKQITKFYERAYKASLIGHTDVPKYSLFTQLHRHQKDRRYPFGQGSR